MKIGIITTYADKIMTSRSELITSMLDKGHDITVLGSEIEEKCKTELIKFNIDYVRIPFARSNTNPSDEIKFIINTSKALMTLELDIILVYGVRLSSSIAISARLAGVKKVYAIINGAGTLFYMKGLKGRLVQMFSYPLLFTGLHLCNKVIFQNQDNLNLFTKLKLVSKKKSLIVNGSGVNLEKFKSEPLGDEYMFLFIGRMIRDKGISEFIASAKKVKEVYPKSRFLLIGPYDQNLTALGEEELSPLIEDKTIEHIEWTDKVSDYLKESYVFVLPSYHEGTPRTVLEAMATGRPIITTDAPGCRETVVDGVNGFLIPIRNIEILSEKMIWMIENREEAKKMGQESIRICKEKFDVNKINKVILKAMDL